ncbi:unnamed protein product [Rotaria sp. Silwood1]|nr:unnamed protein product [Rotaria sp. Silwood1]CAF4567970.1 unnamed protein product [Rotaria sp. Silwood1]CAF4709315.1 unnamed protein product [Rotaria sp. Silwood1]CAF4832127.1 unnamed protein product [Rotaria sp. Silwood1]CAF4975931.1 unnamed protein product [Rotaria sp. Silwood1]
MQFNCDHRTHYDLNATWSLRNAIITALEKFLDKLETFHCWQKPVNHQIPETATTTSINFIIDLDDDLSNISKDESIHISMPKFNKQERTLPPPDYDPHALIITTTQEETNEFNFMEEEQS